MKNKSWISIILLITISSCSGQIDSKKMWREKIDIDNGAYVFLYHDAKCSKERPFSSVSEDKISFMKMKYDVFDFCFSKEDLEMLNSISKRNIKDYENNAIDYCVNNKDVYYYNRKCAILDTLDCGFSTEYAMRNNKLIKLKKPWHAIKKLIK